VRRRDVTDDRSTDATEPGADPWAGLLTLTAARIGLARSGASLATAPLLAFRLAHARARDAVHAVLDEARLRAGLASLGVPMLTVASAAQDRAQYLMRPDLGRQLADDATALLARHAGDGHDVAIVISDGLSARAVERHAAPLLAALLPPLHKDGWRVAPLAIVRLGRVAIGDAAAQRLTSRMAVILIGERPGLTAPDSMGAYLTWQPGPQTTDADRNCISNIRPEGIDPPSAALKILHLMRAMRNRQLSGIALKDETERLLIGDSSNTR
jgi:ethanolamine ammonia-lyase small subunit